jgi:hypothetical protein
VKNSRAKVLHKLRKYSRYGKKKYEQKKIRYKRKPFKEFIKVLENQ